EREKVKVRNVEWVAAGELAPASGCGLRGVSYRALKSARLCSVLPQRGNTLFPPLRGNRSYRQCIV
ncbi:MAG: hypothetical protein PHR45_08680, partial [Muribaculaceae bacterium]|nr:hypothetical protein [Muribaculaceae bacterium]